MILFGDLLLITNNLNDVSRSSHEAGPRVWFSTWERRIWIIIGDWHFQGRRNLRHFRIIDRDALDTSLNIDKFAMWSRLQDLRNIPLQICQSSCRRGFFHTRLIVALLCELHTRLSRALMDKDPPSQTGSIDWSIFHPVCPLRRIHRSSSAVNWCSFRRSSR